MRPKKHRTRFRRDLEALQSRCWNDLEELQSKFWRHVAALQTEQGKADSDRVCEYCGGGPPPRPWRRPVVRGGTGARKPVSSSTTNSPVMDLGSFDYARFEERFRGSESFVADSQKFYLPYFKGCRRVLDLGCGRGELLESLRKHGVSAEGVDADATAVAACAEKKLPVAHGDLFAFLAEQGRGLGGRNLLFPCCRAPGAEAVGAIDSSRGQRAVSRWRRGL